MICLRLVLTAAACCVFAARGGGAEAGSDVREWTSADGRKLQARYLGMKGEAAVLKLANGTLSEIPPARLCAEDQRFLKTNAFPYRAVWQAWDPRSRTAIRMPEVQEDQAGGAPAGTFSYKTAHFRFVSDVNLGKALMKDLANVFELTYQLQSVSPLGMLAEPADGKFFQAKFYGTLSAYQSAGGLPGTAGLYLLKEKVFLAPLDLMGVKKGSAGWRRDLETYDLTTIVHELTHMLTHDMLNNLPIWTNEGYAEYISRIPIARGAFTTSSEDIRNGVIDTLLIDHERQTRGAKEPRAGVQSKRDRLTFQKEAVAASLFHPAEVLQMTDAKWTGSRSGRLYIGQDPRMPRLYRTAHLILYYFIQIEGEAGVKKVRRFLEENQKRMSAYRQYVEDFKKFDSDLATFRKQPGVEDLGGGRLRYPTTLTPPTAPVAPVKDADTLKLGGLPALLDGESAAAVGQRIEEALKKDLGLNLQFVSD